MREDVIKAYNLNQIFNRIVGIWTGHLLQDVGFHINEPDAKNRVRRVLDAFYFKHRNYELTALESLGIVYYVFIKTEIVYEINGIRIESNDIPLLKLRRFIGEWIVEKRCELQENTQLFNSVSSKPKIKGDKDKLNAAHYLIIEYLTQGEKLDRGRHTVSGYISLLARKYNLSVASVREQLKGMGSGNYRILPYLDIRQLTPGMMDSAKKNYLAVLEYFTEKGDKQMIEKVENVLSLLY